MWNDPVVKDTFFPLLTSYGSGGPICPAFVRGPWAAGLDDVRNETGPYKSTHRGGSRALVPNLQTTNLGVRSSNLFGRATSECAIGTTYRRFPDPSRQAPSVEPSITYPWKRPVAGAS